MADRHAEHKKLVASSEERLAALEKLLGVAEVAQVVDLPKVTREEAYDRKINSTVLRFSAKAPFDIKELQKVVEPLLQQARLSRSDVSYRGGQKLSKRATVQFEGAPLLAHRKLQAFREVSFNGGEWKEIYVSDTVKRPQKVFVSMDKNPRTIRTERALKVAARVSRELYPDKEFTIDKHLGELQTSYIGILNVVAEYDQVPELRADMECCQMLQVDPRKIKAAFTRAWSDTPTPAVNGGAKQWSCI